VKRRRRRMSSTIAAVSPGSGNVTNKSYGIQQYTTYKNSTTSKQQQQQQQQQLKQMPKLNSCNKFIPQAFNSNKCQQCFNFKTIHSMEALAEFTKVRILFFFYFCFV
jgi:transcription initiation factor TFIID subunit TAF12